MIHLCLSRLHFCNLIHIYMRRFIILITHRFLTLNQFALYYTIKCNGNTDFLYSIIQYRRNDAFCLKFNNCLWTERMMVRLVELTKFGKILYRSISKFLWWPIHVWALTVVMINLMFWYRDRKLSRLFPRLNADSSMQGHVLERCCIE